MKTWFFRLTLASVLGVSCIRGGLAGRPSAAFAADPDKNPKAPAGATAAPAGQDGAVQGLLNDLNDPSTSQRIKAALELAKLGERACPAARALCAMALDGQEATRNAALDALQKVRPDLYRQVYALLNNVDLPQATPAPVEFTHLDAHWAADGPSGKAPAVSVRVKNVGEKTIINLQVAITFLDASGKIVDQETGEVVNSALVHAAEKVRLGPNQTRLFSFKAKKCPAEWHEGKFAVDVQSIDFAD